MALALAAPAARAGDVVEYFHLDAIGNIRVVTDQNKNVIERHDYFPFGEECTTGPCASNPGAGFGQPRKFTGKERDAETGLDYFGARYYGAKVGRFTTVDPFLDQQAALFNPQRWNRYVYVSNNPLRYVDPDGREQAVIVGGRTYMGGVDGLSAGDEQARAQVFNILLTTVGIATTAGTGYAAGGARQAAKGVFEEVVENITGVPTSVSIGRFLKGADVADAAANARRGIQEGCCVTGVVDRAGAAARRAERLKGVDPRKGYDRDEFPPAVVKLDNPSGYRVDYVNPSQNRRSGSRLGKELKGVRDGMPVRIDPTKE